jgi:hypothetical protein
MKAHGPTGQIQPLLTNVDPLAGVPDDASPPKWLNGTSFQPAPSH